MKLHLFYANQLVEEIELSPSMWRHIRETHGDEIYQGGWLFCRDADEWYRCDSTPALLADVPKDLRVLALLLI